MALKQFPVGFSFVPFDLMSLSISNSNPVIDATGEAAACIWRSPFTGTIRSIVVRFGSVTTGGTISAELQTVNTATATPTDTIYAAGAGNSFSLTTTMANTWQTISLSAPAVVTAGEMVALVIKRNDVGGAGNFQVVGPVFTGLGRPTAATKALTWSTGNSNLRCIYPIYSETAAVASIQQFAAWTRGGNVLSAGAAVDEVGNVIGLPFAARVTGWFMQMSASAGTTTKIRLYATDGTTIMASAVWNGIAPDAIYWGTFESQTVLTVNSLYRIAAFVSVGAATLTNVSLADLTAIGTLHLGSLCYATSRTDAGAWSDNPQARVQIGLIIDQLDDSAASGGAAGGLAHIIGGP